MLLKLSVEGGDYCMRGIKRASAELTHNILLRKKPAVNDDESFSMDHFEQRIAVKLQMKREAIIQNQYFNIVPWMPNILLSDTHSFDLYRLYLSYGFNPLTENESSNFKLLELFIWELYAKHRNQMTEHYLSSILDVFEPNDNLDFGCYILMLINNNPKLTDEQKEAFLLIYTEGIPDRGFPADSPIIKQAFQRLMLVSMGVLIAE